MTQETASFLAMTQEVATLAMTQEVASLAMTQETASFLAMTLILKCRSLRRTALLEQGHV